MREYESLLRARFGGRLREVFLFGSYARGDAHEDSDVDILALVDDLAWKEKVEAIDLAAAVSLRSGAHLSAVVMSSEDFQRLIALESAFAHAVLDEGIHP